VSRNDSSNERNSMPVAARTLSLRSCSRVQIRSFLKSLPSLEDGSTPMAASTCSPAAACGQSRSLPLASTMAHWPRSP
jgi:hypothetical protein